MLSRSRRPARSTANGFGLCSSIQSEASPSSSSRVSLFSAMISVIRTGAGVTPTWMVMAVLTDPWALVAVRV